MKEFIPFNEDELSLLDDGYQLQPLQGVIQKLKKPTVLIVKKLLSEPQALTQEPQEHRNQVGVD